MLVPSLKLSLPILATVLIASSCQGKVGEVVRPDAMTADQAMAEGGSCTEVGARDTPLVVDMKAMQRADLEEVMRSGVAVVHYDCNELTLLVDCKVPGDYGFLAVSKKEESVQMASADDVRANLPVSGDVLVSAGYGSKSSIDLATVMIGKRTTSVRAAGTGDAAGSCDSATHFVRGAYVGAFAVKTGTIGEIEAAASVFKYGFEGASKSEKNVDRRDGDPASCAQVDLDSETPPADCSALLRLELVALAEGTAVPTSDPQPASEETCPQGLVRVGGLCTSDASQPHECSPEDEADCTAQCDNGNALSCAHLGVLKVKAGQADAGKVLLTKACDAGVGRGCNGLGVIATTGLVGAPDPTTGVKRYRQACEQGCVPACHNVAFQLEQGQGVPKDVPQAMAIYKRGCDGGLGNSCHNLGALVQPTDAKQAAELYTRGCQGGFAPSCGNLAQLHTDGEGVAKDPARAAALRKQACAGGVKKACS